MKGFHSHIKEESNSLHKILIFVLATVSYIGAGVAFAYILGLILEYLFA